LVAYQDELAPVYLEIFNEISAALALETKHE
jgi:hypothetical protein